MSEEDVRVGLRDAVADEPPLDFDPDALVASARHQAKRRRALLAAGVATVAVVAAAVAVPVALGRGETRVGAPPASTTTTTTSSRPSTIDPGRYTVGDLRRRGQQMAAHLRDVVPDVLPKASEFDYGEFGGEAAGQFYEGQTSVNAPVSFTLGNARYSLFVTVWVPGTPSMSPTEVCAGSGANCEQFGERDGGPIVLKTENLGDETISTLYHFRTSGGVVQLAAYNYDMASRTPPKYMPSVPVTIDQLTRLATDPDLGL